MQTKWQSLLEVGVDFICSVGINIGGQLTFYTASATAGRVTLLASLVLTLSFVRRFATRRVFEVYLPPGNPHWYSVVEAVSDTLLGFLVGVVLQMVVYGDAATWGRASSLTLGLYGATMVRRYLLRRLFVWVGQRTTVSAAT